MSNTKYAFSFASLTDVGLVRQLNEDRELILNINQDAKAFIVCDGMGGHDSGDKASEAAVRFISEFLQTKPIDNATISLVNAIKFANQQIYFESKVSPTSKGMGTTAVVLLQFQDEILVGHVGDSRAYRFTDNQLTQITKDHSVVQEMVNQGLISQIQAEHHPRKNEITKALGIRENEEPTVSNNIKAVKGDRFILCSDGLSGLISHEAFTDAVRKHSDPNVCAMKLVQMAKNGGGHDNITVQVIDVIESPNKAPKKSTSKQTIMLGAAASFVGILALSTVLMFKYTKITSLKKPGDFGEILSSKPIEEINSNDQNNDDFVSKEKLISLLKYSSKPDVYTKLITKSNKESIKKLKSNHLIDSIKIVEKDTLYKLSKLFKKQIQNGLEDENTVVTESGSSGETPITNETDKQKKERLKKEKLEREKLAKLKADQEKAEKEKAEKEKAEKEKAEKEKAEKEKAEKEKAEKEKAEKEKALKEKAAKEKAEKEKAAKERKRLEELQRRIQPGK